MNRKIKKEIHQLIKEAQVRGEPDIEIYNSLVEEYGYKKTIAEIILTTVKPKDKKKHHLYVGILSALTVVMLFFNLWVVITSPDLSFWDDYLSFWYVFWRIGVYVLSYIVFLNIICQKPITFYVFWMYSYSYLIFYFTLWFIICWNNIWSINLMYIGINLIFLFIAIFLFRYFQRKIFPNYRYRKLKTDENGNYVFS